MKPATQEEIEKAAIAVDTANYQLVYATMRFRALRGAKR